MKLCVVSNSHAASLKLAWDNIASRHPDTALAFYASAGHTMGSLAPDLEARCLYPTDPQATRRLEAITGGASRLFPEAHDAVLLYGLRFVLPRLDRRLSGAVARAAATEALTDSIAWQLLRKLRQIAGTPIFLAPEPLLAPPTGLHRLGAGIAGACRSPDEVCDLVEPLLHDVDATLLRQPEASVVKAFHTDPRYSVGSVRLTFRRRLGDHPHPPEDKRHMNAEYGILYLDHSLPRIRAALARRGQRG